MALSLIGYFPKRRVARIGWVSPYPDHPEAQFPVGPPVDEICSVSHCISGRPDPPADAPDWNLWGGYDTPDHAEAAIQPNQRGDYAICAYRVVPVLFEDGVEEPIDDLQPVIDTPLPDRFERLGYDAVELTYDTCLGCSPLSCNGQAGTVAGVNRYCLMDTEAEAREVARRFSVDKPEPGPYAVVEVLRERQR